jgi:hypothetical protein
MEIETFEDLRSALNEIGYSKSAIEEIIKWYSGEKTVIC